MTPDETPAQHIRNALQLLRTYQPSERVRADGETFYAVYCFAQEDVQAVRRLLEAALSKLEPPPLTGTTSEENE